jgi:hypothetical protein
MALTFPASSNRHSIHYIMIKHILTLILLSATLVSAADPKKQEKKPKEMKPKLVEANTVLVKDDFEAATLAPIWISEKESEGLVLENGHVRVDGPAGGARGLIETRFAAPVKDVHLQFSFKPHACESIAIGFRQKTSFGYAVYGKIDRFAVVDRTKAPDGQPPYVSSFTPVQVNTEKLGPTKWRRYSIECKGEKLLVRQDNKVIAELEHPFVGEEKTALVVAGYGGVFMIDDVFIATPEKK